MGELARISDTKTPTISLVEKGQRTPPADSVSRWADALDLDGHQRDEFIEAGAEAKAEAQSDAIPHLKDLRDRADRAEAELAALTVLISADLAPLRDEVLAWAETVTPRELGEMLIIAITANHALATKLGQRDHEPLHRHLVDALRRRLEPQAIIRALDLAQLGLKDPT